MAVTQVTAPAQYSPIGNGIWWKLNLDSFGVDPLKNKIICRLFRDTNAPLTGLLTHKPPGIGTPEDFVIDATKAIKDAAIIRTSIPVNGFGGFGSVENETNIFKGVYLRYGEIVYDSTDCTVSNDDLDSGTNSAVVYAVNAAKNLFDGSQVNFNGIDPFILNHVPCPLNVFYDTRAWVWVWNAESVRVLHTAYYADGTTQTLAGSANAMWKCAIFAITNASLNGYFNESGLFKIESRIYYTTEADGEDPSTDIGTFVTFYSPCNREQVYHELYLLDPLGGLNTFIGERIDTSADSDQQEIELPLDIQSPDHVAQGLQIVEKDTRIEHTLYRKLPNTEEHQRYAQALESATKALIRIKDDSGTSKLAGFILDGGVQIFRTDSMIEVTMTGKIGTSVLTQI